MWRGIRAEEELGIAGNGRRDQCFTMGFTFQHRQAVVVRTYPADEDGVAVVTQMLDGDRRGYIVTRRLHELGGLLGGDVLEHHAQARMARQQGFHHGVDEDVFAVKKVG